MAEAASRMDDISSFLSDGALTVLANASIAGSEVNQTYLDTVVVAELLNASMFSFITLYQCITIEQWIGILCDNISCEPNSDSNH